MIRVNRFAIVWLLTALIGLTACSKASFTPLPASPKLLAFGDSLTVGVGVKPAQSYPSQLANILGIEVINAGVSGEETSAGLARLPGILDTHQPDLVILLEGGNDILRSRDHATIANHLAAMIEMIISRGAQVLLLGVPSKGLSTSAADFYPALAEKYQLVYDGAIIGELLFDRQYKSDTIHFNELGYGRLASHLAELLREGGALP